MDVKYNAQGVGSNIFQPPTHNPPSSEFDMADRTYAIWYTRHMKKFYHFSPMTTAEDLSEAARYIATMTTQLCKKITGSSFPIPDITVFSHYSEEFEKLKKIVQTLGSFVKENNGPFVKLREPLRVVGSEISLLRVRHPDPYRSQVGCNDFQVPDYDAFKHTYLTEKYQHNVRVFQRPEYEMIELFDPEYDVLAYVLSENND